MRRRLYKVAHKLFLAACALGVLVGVAGWVQSYLQPGDQAVRWGRQRQSYRLNFDSELLVRLRSAQGGVGLELRYQHYDYGYRDDDALIQSGWGRPAPGDNRFYWLEARQRYPWFAFPERAWQRWLGVDAYYSRRVSDPAEERRPGHPDIDWTTAANHLPVLAGAAAAGRGAVAGLPPRPSPRAKARRPLRGLRLRPPLHARPLPGVRPARSRRTRGRAIFGAFAATGGLDRGRN